MAVGITIPNVWKNKIHVPNHQPDMVPNMCFLSLIDSSVVAGGVSSTYFIADFMNY